jgi:predicted transcriptional regulator
MTLRSILAASLLLLPLMASAHNFVDGQRVAPVGVADRGELFWIRISLAIKTGIARSWREKCAWCSTSPDARRQKRKMPT